MVSFANPEPDLRRYEKQSAITKRRLSHLPVKRRASISPKLSFRGAFARDLLLGCHAQRTADPSQNRSG